MTQIPIEDETAGGDAEGDQPIEEQLERLDAIVEKLESEAVSLDQSIALFEEGVELAVQIRRRLQVSEGRIREIVERSGGLFSLEDFNL